jgi:hypothetical protein
MKNGRKPATEADRKGQYYLRGRRLGLWPIAKCELAIAHICQLPRLRLELPIDAAILLVTRSPGHKHGSHEMVICTVRIPELRVLHEPSHGSSKLRPAVVSDDVFEGLTEFESPGLRSCLLSEIVRVPEHRSPAVAVQIVNGAPRANEQVTLFP